MSQRLFLRLRAGGTPEDTRGGLVLPVFRLSDAIQNHDWFETSSDPRAQRHRPKIHVRLLRETVQTEARLGSSHRQVSHERLPHLQILRHGREEYCASRVEAREDQEGQLSVPLQHLSEEVQSVEQLGKPFTDEAQSPERGIRHAKDALREEVPIQKRLLSARTQPGGG